MKKLFYAFFLIFVLSAMLQGCGSKNTSTSETSEINKSENRITEEKAYAGVNNYCHSAYDWSVAEDNPTIMYIEMGEESETEYQVVFRSYTGAFVYFYVDKSSGATRMIEYEPNLNVEKEMGSINLYDYLNEQG